MKEYVIIMITAVWTCLIVKITPKLSINLQDTHDIQYAPLMIQKTDTIFIGEKIPSKSFVKI